MPIQYAPVEELWFNDLDATQQWVAESQQYLERLPCHQLFESGVTFRDDQYLDDGVALLHFNRLGLQAICQQVGYRVDHVARLTAPGLATAVLNDVASNPAGRSSLADQELVVDTRTGTIIGLVSETYVTYPNSVFLRDIGELLATLPANQSFEFYEAYAVNSELTVRFISDKLHGSIVGRGGVGEDRSQLGLEFRNSVVGGSSLRINYFLKRLICANGLMVPAAESINRVFHSGNLGTFRDRVARCFREVVRNITTIHGLLEMLGSMDFAPMQLARSKSMVEKIFDVIPGAKQQISEAEQMYLRYPNDATALQREQLRRGHDASLIGLIPKYFGGETTQMIFGSRFRDRVSLFDFVNVFTEHAKRLDPAQRLHVEENAGRLAKYIAENVSSL